MTNPKERYHAALTLHAFDEKRWDDVVKLAGEGARRFPDSRISSRTSWNAIAEFAETEIAARMSASAVRQLAAELRRLDELDAARDREAVGRV